MEIHDNLTLGRACKMMTQGDNSFVSAVSKSGTVIRQGAGELKIHDLTLATTKHMSIRPTKWYFCKFQIPRNNSWIHDTNGYEKVVYSEDQGNGIGVSLRNMINFSNQTENYHNRRGAGGINVSSVTCLPSFLKNLKTNDIVIDDNIIKFLERGRTPGIKQNGDVLMRKNETVYVHEGKPKNIEEGEKIIFFSQDRVGEFPTPQTFV